MEIKVERNRFLESLSLASNVVSAKATLPILNNVLIETDKEKNKIVITGTDLEIGVIVKCDAQILEGGSITIPAKKLFEIIRELPEGEIDLNAGKNTTIAIKTKKTLFKISGLEPTDFPTLPKPTSEKTFEIDQNLLKECLSTTSFAASRDEARYTLNGVLVILKDNLIKFVATDGKRLALVERKINTPKGSAFEAILPTKTINELLKTLSGTGNVKITHSQNQILFEQENITVSSRLIEGKFPNYEQVIPKEEKTTAKVERSGLLGAVKRMSLLTSQENQSVKLDFTKGKILVSARTPNLGEAKEELDAEISGEDLTIGFNPAYLVEVLKNMTSDAVMLSLSGQDKPGLLKETKDYLYLYVVMPMQLTY